MSMFSQAKKGGYSLFISLHLFFNSMSSSTMWSAFAYTPTWSRKDEKINFRWRRIFALFGFATHIQKFITANRKTFYSKKMDYEKYFTKDNIISSHRSRQKGKCLNAEYGTLNIKEILCWMQTLLVIVGQNFNKFVGMYVIQHALSNVPPFNKVLWLRRSISKHI